MRRLPVYFLLDCSDSMIGLRQQTLERTLGVTRHIDETILTLVKDAAGALGDPSTVTFTGRCQKTRRPYLMRYDRMPGREVVTRDFRFTSGGYALAGCFMLDEEYVDWAYAHAPAQTVSTTELAGVPGCPHCGSESAFAMCGWGRFLCTDGHGAAKCPWCEQQLHFSPPSGVRMDVQKGMN